MPTSQTTVYRLDPSLMEAEERRLLTTQLPRVLMINVVFILFVFVMMIRKESDSRVIVGLLVFWALLVAGIVFNSIRRLKKCVRDIYATYTLEIDDQGLTKQSKDFPTTRINFAEISSIEEVEGKWLTVLGKSSSQRIGIPTELIGFNEVRDRLRAYGEIQKKSYPWYRIYAAIPYLLTFVGATFAKSPLVIVSSCVAMWLFLGWALIYVQRSPMFLKKTKRTMWLAFFPALSVIPRFLGAIEQLRR